MVFLRGPNLLGPDNRDERGAYETLDDRIQSYMLMDDQEWNTLYQKMFLDRKYPGYNKLSLILVPTFGYSVLTGAFSYELWLKRSALLGSSGNIAKLVAIPFLGLMTLRNLDIITDIIRYRRKYPEMYQ